MIGSTLSHYRITSLLGEGGMGTVYRAEDTHLHREVAIKVLPEGLTADPERLARFEREAQVLASLNHPHIGAIYGLEQDEGSHFLVLELIEGDTLEERLARGPLPIEDALGQALQIVEGLEAAHEQGVVHRDLKPANIKITPDGTIKLLDFGLAKAAAPMPASGVDLSQSPTMTAGMTQAGMILGTAGYMSPEQARGQVVDKRADIWAFGVVLHEMLTGTSLFAGESVTDLLAAVVRGEIDLEALPDGVPSSVRQLLSRCLDRDPTLRLRDVGEARILLEDFLSDPSAEEPVAAGQPVAPPLWRRLTPWALLPVLAAAAWWLKPATEVEPFPVVRFDLEMPEGERLRTWSQQAMSLSPDGRLLAFVAVGEDPLDNSLYLRDLSQREARRIPGTQGALQPRFSPDGQWISYVHVALDLSTRLMKVAASGGEPVEICDCPVRFGADWGPDDTIVFAKAFGPLQQVSARGGNPTPLTTLEENTTSQRLPHFLPGGKALLFTTQAGTFDWSRTGIDAFSLETGEIKRLIEVGSDARYLPSGHLVFAREGNLIAAPFDPQRLEITGPEVTALNGVHHAIYANHSSFDTGAIQLTTSTTGLLAYAPGSTLPESARTVVIVDRQGREQPLELQPREYNKVMASNDGRSLLLGFGHPPQDIWLYDLDRDLMRRQTFEGGHDATHPIWGPGDGRFTFASKRKTGATLVYTKLIDSGPGEAEELIMTEEVSGARPTSWSPGGEQLSLLRLSDEAGFDTWIYSDDQGARPFLASRFNELFPELSPDGRWMVHVSTASGRPEVYVVGFPEPGPATQISIGGGSGPAWSRDGREIFFIQAGEMYSVAVQVEGNRIVPGTAVHVMSFPYSNPSPARAYDPLPDGRFAVIKDPDEAAQDANQELVFPRSIQLVQNWFAELEERVPTSGRNR